MKARGFRVRGSPKQRRNAYSVRVLKPLLVLAEQQEQLARLRQRCERAQRRAALPLNLGAACARRPLAALDQAR
jgi:hypothetical protein